MKYLVLEVINENYYLVGNKPFDEEQQAYKMVDLQRECNPKRSYQIVHVLEEENLEVVK